MKLIGIILLVCLESVPSILSLEESNSSEEKQRENRPIRLIQSVNPSPQVAINFQPLSVGINFNKLKEEDKKDSNSVNGRALGGFLPLIDSKGQQEVNAQSSGAEQIDEDSGLNNGDGAIQVDRRSWKSKDEREKIAIRREAVMNLLLQELPMLDIGGVNDQSDPNKSIRRMEEEREQVTTPISSELALAAASNSNNRHRGGLSAFIISGGTKVVGNQLATPFQIIPASMVINMGVNSFPKRAPNHHVPCFFNAITCF